MDEIGDLSCFSPLIKFYHIFCSLGTLCVLWKQKKNNYIKSDQVNEYKSKHWGIDFIYISCDWKITSAWITAVESSTFVNWVKICSLEYNDACFARKDLLFSRVSYSLGDYVKIWQ